VPSQMLAKTFATSLRERPDLGSAHPPTAFPFELGIGKCRPSLRGDLLVTAMAGNQCREVHRAAKGCLEIGDFLDVTFVRDVGSLRFTLLLSDRRLVHSR
jgi:hypothetical protein